MGIPTGILFYAGATISIAKKKIRKIYWVLYNYMVVLELANRFIILRWDVIPCYSSDSKLPSHQNFEKLFVCINTRTAERSF